jgi:hypothetical protein
VKISAVFLKMVPRSLQRQTASDDLERTIEALKKLLSVAWSDLANPLLTPFERREARNQIRQHGAELRRYLQAMEAYQTFGARARQGMLKVYHATFQVPACVLFPRINREAGPQPGTENRKAS